MSVSVLHRIWRRIVNPTSCVGKDLEGNRYYEYPSPHGDSWRTKRVVKYRRGYDMWTYVAGDKRLPVQWSSWLTHTRMHPPTLEELIADLERQRRVLLNAAMIEARDQQANEAARIAPANESPRVSPTAENSSAQPVRPSFQAKPEVAQETTPSQESAHQQPDPSRQIPPSASDETQSWAPRIIRRGG